MFEEIIVIPISLMIKVCGEISGSRAWAGVKVIRKCAYNSR